MKRKLRTWVKVTIGLVSAATLSAAASCSNTALRAGARPSETMTHALPEKPQRPIKQASSADGKHRRGALVMEEEHTLYVPKLVKEVVNI